MRVYNFRNEFSFAGGFVLFLALRIRWRVNLIVWSTFHLNTRRQHGSQSLGVNKFNNGELCERNSFPTQDLDNEIGNAGCSRTREQNREHQTNGLNEMRNAPLIKYISNLSVSQLQWRIWLFRRCHYFRQFHKTLSI